MDTVRSVLFVLPSTAVGGAEIRFFHLMKNLHGFHCVLLTQAPVAEYFSHRGIVTHIFEGDGCHNPMSVSWLKTLRYARSIAKTVRNRNIDVIVGIMHTGCFYVSAAKDIFRLKTPHIGTILGNISAFFGKQERAPTLTERLMLRYLLRRPDVIVVPSQGVRDDLRKRYGVPDERISLVYNGVDIAGIRELASHTTALESMTDAKTIVTACRLNAQKDFITLLKALREVKKTVDTRLIIVGDGELREEILSHARSLHVEGDVIITGFRENPFPYIKHADVFVLSSFFEGFGNVIVEAMALGVPVVATDCPSGPSEIIQHGVNGLLVPVQDHGKMAEAVIHILTDKKTRNQLSAHGPERAASFRMETMVEGFSRLIEKFSDGRMR